MNLQSARERRDAIKAARLSQAQAVMAGENQGVSGSSGVAGGVGSIQSQLNSNLSFLDRSNTLTDMASQQIGYANKFTQKARTGEAVGNLAQTIFQNSATLNDMWKQR